MTSLEKRTNIFGKDKSIQLKGIAILMMVYTHLFYKPEQRVPGSNVLSVFLGKNHLIINIILRLAEICLPFFIFIAGYAVCIAIKNNSFSFKKTASKLYPKIWLVLLVFVPVLLAMGKIKANPLEMVLNATGFYYSYCGEWWFFGLYILLTLFVIILKKTKILYNPYFLVGVSIFLLIVGYIIKMKFPKFIQGDVGQPIYYFLIKQPIYFSGYLCCKYSVFERIVNAFKHKWYYLLILLWLFQFTKIPESFYLPFVVPGVILVLSEIRKGKVIEKVLTFLGKNSTYMWLTHSILIYSVAPKIVYYFHYSIIDFITILILDIPVAIGFNYLEKGIGKGINKLKKKSA